MPSVLVHLLSQVAAVSLGGIVCRELPFEKQPANNMTAVVPGLLSRQIFVCGLSSVRLCAHIMFRMCQLLVSRGVTVESAS